MDLFHRGGNARPGREPRWKGTGEDGHKGDGVRSQSSMPSTEDHSGVGAVAGSAKLRPPDGMWSVKAWSWGVVHTSAKAQRTFHARANPQSFVCPTGPRSKGPHSPPGALLWFFNVPWVPRRRIFGAAEAHRSRVIDATCEVFRRPTTRVR